MRSTAQPRRARLSVIVTWLLLPFTFGCGSDPVFLTLTIEDPARLANQADFVTMSSGSGPLGDPLPITSRFPLTAIVTGEDGVEGSLLIEARRGEQVVAASRVMLRFDATRTDAVSAPLSAVCLVDADCLDASFCNGEEVCIEGVCRSSERACLPPAIPCVVVSCVEERRACEVSVDPALDDRNPCTVDLCGPEGASHRTLDDGASCELGAGGMGQCLSGACVE